MREGFLAAAVAVVCGLAQLPPFNCSTHRCPSVCLCLSTQCVHQCSPPQLMTAVGVCWCRTCSPFFAAFCCCRQCREWHTTVPQHTTTHAHTLIDAFVFFFFFSLFRLSAAATAEVSHRVTGLRFCLLFCYLFSTAFSKRWLTRIS